MEDGKYICAPIWQSHPPSFARGILSTSLNERLVCWASEDKHISTKKISAPPPQKVMLMYPPPNAQRTKQYQHLTPYYYILFIYLIFDTITWV